MKNGAAEDVLRGSGDDQRRASVGVRRVAKLLLLLLAIYVFFFNFLDFRQVCLSPVGDAIVVLHFNK